MTRRSRGFVFPVILIAIGVIFLLVNTGTLSAGSLQRLGDLWPLILVIVGVQLVLSHTLPRATAQLAGVAVALLLIAAAIAYAIAAPAARPGTEHQESSEALQGMTAATLDLSYGAATIDLRTGAPGDLLFQAGVDYPSGESPPDVSLDRQAGTLTISGGDRPAFRLFGQSQTRHIVVTLSNRISWTIQISGGAAAMDLQLAELSLSKLQISGGASRLDVTLPRPKGALRVGVDGAVSALTIRAAAATEWKVSVSGGVSSLDINGSRFGALGNLKQQSHGYDAATDRLELEVSGGVSHVTLHTG